MNSRGNAPKQRRRERKDETEEENGDRRGPYTRSRSDKNVQENVTQAANQKDEEPSATKKQLMNAGQINGTNLSKASKDKQNVFMSHVRARHNDDDNDKRSSSLQERRFSVSKDFKKGLFPNLSNGTSVKPGHLTQQQSESESPRTITSSEKSVSKDPSETGGATVFRSRLPRLQLAGASKFMNSYKPSDPPPAWSNTKAGNQLSLNDISKTSSEVMKPQSDFFVKAETAESYANSSKKPPTEWHNSSEKAQMSPRKSQAVNNGKVLQKPTADDSGHPNLYSVSQRLPEAEDARNKVSDSPGKNSSLERKDKHENCSGESGEDSSGRKFTLRFGKAVLGSSTTLSSNTESTDESSDVFNVVLRVRPLNSQEKGRRDKFVAEFPGDGLVSVKNSGTSRKFQFNVVFEPDATQEDVFDNCGMKRLVDAALNGFTCTAFAFGQTGSGKTHTMTGPPGQFHTEGVAPDPRMYGIIQRSFKYLYQQVRRQATPKIIRASYLEIYNEQVFDLLNSNHGKHLAVRWSKNKGFYVENLFTVMCETIDDLMAVLEEGLRNRQTGSHGLNEFSSRSHSVLTVTVDSETRPDPEDENVYITNKGKLSFVDLAGSEKVKDATSPGGTGMMESNNINKSLLVLGNCISHLGDAKRRQGHIPYRDSKLTKLLSDSLAGNGITLMIACITPSSSNITETVNTLRYASRAKTIRTRPAVKTDPRETLIVTLKKEVRILRQENHYLRQQQSEYFIEVSAETSVISPKRNPSKCSVKAQGITLRQLDFPAKPKGQLQKENDEKFLKFMKQQEQKESGLYEMLQEYMVENESLRAENSEMHSLRENTRREQQVLHKENEQLTQRVEELERLLSHHPGIWASTNHRRTDGYSQKDLSPRESPRTVGYVSPSHRPAVMSKDLPLGDGRNKVDLSGYQGQTMKPPHWLPDHVVRPAPRPVDYVEENGYTDSYTPPRYNSQTKPGPGGSSFRSKEQVFRTDSIREMNDRLLMEVRQLDGEIAQHTRVAHAPKSTNRDFNR